MAGPPEREDEIRDRMKHRIAQWRSEGFDTSALEDIVENDLRAAKDEFDKYRRKIYRLKDLEVEVLLLDKNKYGADIENIRSMLKDVERMDEAENALEDLKKRIAAGGAASPKVKANLADNERVQRWKKLGYDITFIETAPDLEVALKEFSDKVDELKDLERRFTVLDVKGYELMAHEIVDSIKDVRKIERVRKLIEDIELSRAAERRRAEREAKENEETATVPIPKDIAAVVYEDITGMPAAGQVRAIFSSLFGALFKRLLKDGHNLVAKSSRMVAKIQESTPFLKSFKISEDGTVVIEVTKEPVRSQVKFFAKVLDFLVDLAAAEKGMDKAKAMAIAISVAEEVLANFEPQAGSLEVTQTILKGAISKKVRSGIDGFDELVDGGLPKKAAVILQAPPGVEKEMFLYQFIRQGLKSDEAIIVILSNITPSRFRERMKDLGVETKPYEEKGLLVMIDWYSFRTESIVGVDVDGAVIKSSQDLTNVGIAINKALKAIGDVQSKRAVVEVISPASQLFEFDIMYRFATITKQKFRNNGFTSIFPIDKEMHDAKTLSSFHQVFDGVIEIEKVRDGNRVMSNMAVLSMADTTFNSDFHKLEVRDGLLAIPDTIEARGVAEGEAAAEAEAAQAAADLEKVKSYEAHGEEEDEEKTPPIDPKQYFREKAFEWSRMGYKVASLEAILQKDDLHLIEDTFTEFEDGIIQVQLQKERLRKLDTRGFEEDVANLDEMLKSPSAVYGVIPEIDKLEEHIDLTRAKEEMRARKDGKKPERRERKEEEGLEVPVAVDVIEESEEEAAEGEEGEGGREGEEVGEVEETEEDAEAVEAEGEEGGEVEEEERWPSKGKTDEYAPHEVQGFGREDGLIDGSAVVDGISRYHEEGGLTDVTGMVDGREERAMARGRGATGLMNGRGITNGKGLVNGNGMINGRGITNGKGFVNGKGLVNGRGITNGKGLIYDEGIVNGRSITNGKGLTNGDGFINGTRVGRRGTGRGRAMSTARGRRDTGISGKTAAVIVIVILLAGLFSVMFYLSTQKKEEGIAVDGKFNDWKGAEMVSDSMSEPSTGGNGNIDIIKTAIMADNGHLSVYLEVRDGVFDASGGEVDALVVFIDSDRNAGTGYQVDGIGADHMMKAQGAGGRALGPGLFRFDGSRDRQDWNGWISSGGVRAAASGNKLELQASLSNMGLTDRAVVAAVADLRDYEQDHDTSHVFADERGAMYLSIINTKVSQALTAGASNQVQTISAMATGTDVSLTSITFTTIGSAAAKDITGITVASMTATATGGAPQDGKMTATFSPPLLLVADRNTDLQVAVTVASAGQATQGATLGLLITDIYDVSANVRAVTVDNPPPEYAYISSPSTAITIDGIFSDWAGITARTDTDAAAVANPDIDINTYKSSKDAANTSMFFYFNVKGQMMSGSLTPHIELAPSSGSGGGGGGTPPPLPELKGADFAYIMLDTDANGATGYAYKDLGADNLVEIWGIEGRMAGSLLKKFTGQAGSASWSWSDGSSITAANDEDELEAKVAYSAVQSSAATDVRAYIYMSDWQRNKDDVPASFSASGSRSIDAEDDRQADLWSDDIGTVIISAVMPVPALGSDANAETIMLKIVSPVATMAGWAITDMDSVVNEFPTTLTPVPGDIILVHAGTRIDDAMADDGIWDVYLGSDVGIWDDDGDDVLLVDAFGKGVDYMAYEGDGPSKSIQGPASTGLGWTASGPGENGNAPAPMPGQAILRSPSSSDPTGSAGEWALVDSSDVGPLHAPEFEQVLVPLVGVIAIFFFMRRRTNSKK